MVDHVEIQRMGFVLGFAGGILTASQGLLTIVFGSTAVTAPLAFLNLSLPVAVGGLWLAVGVATTVLGFATIVVAASIRPGGGGDPMRRGLVLAGLGVASLLFLGGFLVGALLAALGGVLSVGSLAERRIPT